MNNMRYFFQLSKNTRDIIHKSLTHTNTDYYTKEALHGHVLLTTDILYSMLLDNNTQEKSISRKSGFDCKYPRQSRYRVQHDN